jgi:hypothetical protein
MVKVATADIPSQFRCKDGAGPVRGASALYRELIISFF